MPSTASGAPCAPGVLTRPAAGAVSRVRRRSHSSQGAEPSGIRSRRVVAVRVAIINGAGRRACRARVGRCTRTGTSTRRDGRDSRALSVLGFWFLGFPFSVLVHGYCLRFRFSFPFLAFRRWGERSTQLTDRRSEEPRTNPQPRTQPRTGNQEPETKNRRLKTKNQKRTGNPRNAIKARDARHHPARGRGGYPAIAVY